MGLSRLWRIGFSVCALAVLTVALPTSSAQLPASPTASNSVRSVYVFGQDLVLATTVDSLYKATSNGWHRLNSPGGWWYQVSATPDGVIYLYDFYSSGQIYRSLDAGETWQTTGVLLPESNDYPELSASPISGTLFVGRGSFVSQHWGVYKSIDSGLTWRQVISQPYGYGTAVTYSPDFAEDGTAFVALNFYHGSYGIYKSVDWGETWFPINTGLSLYAFEGFFSVAVSPQYRTDHTAFCTGNGQLYKTVDGGLHWSALPIAGQYDIWTTIRLSPNYAHDQTLLIGSYSEGVWLSRDGGQTAQRLFSGAVDSWGVRQQGQFGSVVPGQLPLPYRTYLPLISHYSAALEMWVVKDEDLSTAYLYRSRDYGVTWEEIPVLEASHWFYLPAVRN